MKAFQVQPPWLMSALAFLLFTGCAHRVIHPLPPDMPLSPDTAALALSIQPESAVLGTEVALFITNVSDEPFSHRIMVEEGSPRFFEVIVTPDGGSPMMPDLWRQAQLLDVYFPAIVIDIEILPGEQYPLMAIDTNRPLWGGVESDPASQELPFRVGGYTVEVSVYPQPGESFTLTGSMELVSPNTPDRTPPEDTLDVGASSGSRCPDAQPVPMCANTDDVMPVSEFIDGREGFIGQTVRVLGMLSAGSPLCTRRVCLPEMPCCNRCGSSLTFLGMSNLEMLNEDNRSLWSCSGDECGLCCGYAIPTGNVVVTGTLSRQIRGLYVIQDAQACVPPR